MVAALLVVPVIFIEARAESVTLLTIADVGNWVIWLVFVAEYVTVVWLTDRKAAYTRKAWLDVFIIVTSFPLLTLGATRLLRLTRLARVLRILRLVRLAAVMTRGGKAARAIFTKRGLGYIVVIAMLVLMGVAGAFAILEETPVADALWWALVTMTTVGYGDMFPVTAAGRISAAILMLLGIGLLAVVTASVAAHFVEGDDKDAEIKESLDQLNARLDHLEELIRGSVDQPSRHVGD